MSQPSPQFQFYPNDFLGGAPSTMTVDEVGAYVLLLCHDWNNCGFAFDAEKLARVCKVPRKRFLAMWEGALSTCFPAGDDGRRYNPRLAREREKQERYRAAMSENGKRGGRPPKSKPDTGSEKPQESRGLTAVKPTESLPVTSYQLPVTENPPSPPSGGKKPRPKADDTRPDVAEVVAHYTTRHPRRSVSLKARRLVARVLDSGWGVADCCAAIDGNADDAWHAEKRKHELEYVLRDDKRDGFREMGERRDAGADVEPPNFLGCDIADVDRWLAAHPGYAA